MRVLHAPLRLPPEMLRPSSCGIFYGWVIVATCLGVRCVSVTAAAMGAMTFLVPALTTDPTTGLTSTRLSTIFAVANWVGATTG